MPDLRAMLGLSARETRSFCFHDACGSPRRPLIRLIASVFACARIYQTSLVVFRERNLLYSLYKLLPSTAILFRVIAFSPLVRVYPREWLVIRECFSIIIFLFVALPNNDAFDERIGCCTYIQLSTICIQFSQNGSLYPRDVQLTLDINKC